MKIDLFTVSSKVKFKLSQATLTKKAPQTFISNIKINPKKKNQDLCLHKTKFSKDQKITNKTKILLSMNKIRYTNNSLLSKIKLKINLKINKEKL